MKIKIKNNFLKICLQFLLVFTLIGGGLYFTAPSEPVFAENGEEEVPTSLLPVEEKAWGIYIEGGIPAPALGMGTEQILEIILTRGLRYVKLIVVALGILFITIAGYTLVISGEKEEELTRAKSGLIYTIIAFVLISMAQEIAQIFDMGTATFFGSPRDLLNRVKLFDRRVEIIITFIKMLLGTIATLMVVISGFKLVVAGGTEEEATKNKNALMYSSGGLLLIFLGDVFINRVFYKINRQVYTGKTGVQPQIDAKAGVEELVGITNLIVSIVGPLAILMVLIGGIMYAISGGEEEKMNKAKRLLFAAGIGLVLIFGAFALVNTIISGRLQTMGAIIN